MRVPSFDGDFESVAPEPSRADLLWQAAANGVLARTAGVTGFIMLIPSTAATAAALWLYGSERAAGMAETGLACSVTAFALGSVSLLAARRSQNIINNLPPQ